MPSAFRRPLTLLVLLTLEVPLAGLAADSRSETIPAAVQMLADVTLIDGECGGVSVNFGRAFQAIESKGLQMTDVLPTGRLRSAFEAAYRTRFTHMSHDDLCGILMRRYAAEIPGLFTTP